MADVNLLAMSLRNLVADARAHGLTVIDLAAIERLLAEHDRRQRVAQKRRDL